MTIRPPPPPPPKDVFFDFASKKQELKAIEPEELTELLDDDLEQWAVGGTRILPPSMKQPPSTSQPQQQSFPPVAYAPSVPPPATRPSSNAAVWAAVIGMTSVFGIAAIVGGVFLLRAHDDVHETQTTQATDTVQTIQTTAPIATTVATTDEQPEVAPLATTGNTTTNATNATTTTPHVATITTTPKAQGTGTLQTFAVASGKPVFVDGKQVGVGGSHIKTTCGKHSISVGTGRARSVDVPCSGTITVGTPDGT